MHLVCISFVLVGAVYVIYWKGPVLRANSSFAQQLAGDRSDRNERRASVVSQRAQSMSKIEDSRKMRPVNSSDGEQVEVI